MKKILLAFVLLSSVNAFAVDARSIRTTADIVEYNDSVGTMMSKLGRPDGKYEYSGRDARGKLVFFTDFYYSIDGLKYTITVLEGKIYRIQWER